MLSLLLAARAWRVRAALKFQKVPPEFKFMSERAVFVTFADGLNIKSIGYRREFENLDVDTKNAHKTFSWHLVKAPIHYVNFVLERAES